jgi:hypothetical protein
VIDDLPGKPLTAGEILKAVDKLNIPNFRGVFMRDFLPSTIHDYESGIVNLDSISGPGSHWVCYSKKRSRIEYFDSYGNLRPPIELVNYFNSSPYRVDVQYNYFPKQKSNSVNCGHLCLDFLNIKK